MTEADALAEHQRANQAGDTGVDVHHRTAREVESTLVEEEAGIDVGCRACFSRGERIRTRPEPDHVRDRVVAEGQPQDDEHEQSALNFTRSASAPTMSAGRDRRESCLEDEEPELGDVGRLAEGAGERVAGHAFQEHLAEAAEERVAAFGEGHQ